VTHLLLAGAGHTHALLLRRWAHRPRQRPAARITLVSRSAITPYSGRLPACFAGRCSLAAASLPVAALCAAAGVTFVEAEIHGLDPGARRLRLAPTAGSLAYDLLSLDVGSEVPRPAAPGVPGVPLLPVRPAGPVLVALEALPPGALVAVIGGGASAVEVAFALAVRGCRVSLHPRGPGLWQGFSAPLAASGIAVVRGPAAGGTALALACTGAQPPAWLASCGLPLAATGRLAVEPDLTVTGWSRVFAVGDGALVRGAERPPAGVWAVKAAPRLHDNLVRCLRGRPLRPWRPARRAVQLLGDSRGRAWLLRGPGHRPVGPSRLLGLWKQSLDGAFLARLQP
jgi:selenide,water dikinase